MRQRLRLRAAQTPKAGVLEVIELVSFCFPGPHDARFFLERVRLPANAGHIHFAPCALPEPLHNTATT
jgi:hypothetical protein